MQSTPRSHQSPRRILLLALLSVSPSQPQPASVEVKHRLALMMSGLLLRQMFQEVLVKMSGLRGNG